MKLFKHKFELKLFGFHIVLSISTYRYWYKRAEQTNLFYEENQKVETV